MVIVMVYCHYHYHILRYIPHGSLYIGDDALYSNPFTHLKNL